jgi:hypothetical protein
MPKQNNSGKKLTDFCSIENPACVKAHAYRYIFYSEEIDKNLANFLNGFGVLKYDINTTNLIKIVSVSGYNITARIGSKAIIFKFPKKYFWKKDPKLTRKDELEECICKWLEDKLSIKIDR